MGEVEGDPYSYCHKQEVNYRNFHKFDDEEHYNYCTVPESGYDGILFASIGVLLACTLPRKYYAICVLIMGGIFQYMNLQFNLGRFGNGIDLWLGMHPAEIFFYIFLPPLLLDSAVRIEFHIFKKVVKQVLVFAFLVVLASALLLAVFLLYGLRLNEHGWQWSHALLFATMVASTDAVAVTAVLKQGGGPETLSALIEGESLFNDATSIVLFEIFLEQVKELNLGEDPWEHGIESVMKTVVIRILWLATGGALIGVAFGIGTRFIFKLLHLQPGRNEHIEVALTVGVSYLCFYVANAVVKVSGVIAVVVYGLYGSATLYWEMSSRGRESGVFKTFWDCIGMVINGMVFLFAGASAVNFFSRAVKGIHQNEGSTYVFFSTFMWLPVIYLMVFLLRFVLITLFSPLLRLFRSPISMRAITFVSFAGLRGALSLIMAQTVVTLPAAKLSDTDEVDDLHRIHAQIGLWTSGFVLFTLLINAPMIPCLLRWTGLSQPSLIKLQLYEQARGALNAYNKKVIFHLQNSADEMMRGVDWAQVLEYIGMVGSGQVKKKKERRIPKALSKSKNLGSTEWFLLSMMNGSGNDIETGAGELDVVKSLDEELLKGTTEEFFSGDIGTSQSEPNPAVVKDRQHPYKRPELNVELLPDWLHKGSGSVVVVSGLSSLQVHTSVDSEASPIPSRPDAPTPGIVPLSTKADRSTSLPGPSTNSDWAAESQLVRDGSGSLGQRGSGTMGMRSWTRVESAKLNTLDENAEDERTPFLSEGIGGHVEDEVLNYNRAAQMWSARGMRRQPSLNTYNTQLLMEARVRIFAGIKTQLFEKKASGLLSNQVCIEYWLALKQSKSQLPLLVNADLVAVLTAEVQAESKQVWRFIIDREIEAPERFEAIQTYRATAAILFQLNQYIDELAKSGMLEENEHEALSDEFEAKSRRLERRGPQWRLSVPSEVLKSVPFMSNVSTDAFMDILRNVKLTAYASGEEIGGDTSEAGNVYIVVSGLLKGNFKDSQGEKHDFFLGKGGVVGLLPALVRSPDVAMGTAHAELNALGRGPVIMTLPASLIRDIAHKAARGEEEYQQLELDMFRLAAVYLVENMHEDIVESVTSFLLKYGLPVGHDESGDKLGQYRKAHVMHPVVKFEGDEPQIMNGGGPGVVPASEPSADGAPSGTLLRDYQLEAAKVFEHISDSINDGHLLLLPPGLPVDQGSSMVLLHGSLLTAPLQQTKSNSPFLDPSGPKEGSLEIPSPSTLPFVSTQDQDLDEVEVRTYWAGPAGAIILSCPAPEKTLQQHDSLTQESGAIVRRNVSQRRWKKLSNVLKASIVKLPAT